MNLPNLVSASRLLLAAGFAMTDSVAWRLGLLATAAVTDMLDGWLARRTQVTSRFGALLDPVADRLFALAVVLSYVAGGELRAWQAVAVLFRDVMSVVGFFVARAVRWLRPITFRARWLGKVVTVLQVALFVAVLAWPAAVDRLVLLVAAAGLAATVDYTLMLWRERDESLRVASRR